MGRIDSITMSCDATSHAVSCALHFVCGGACYSHMLYAVSVVPPVACIMLVCCLLHLSCSTCKIREWSVGLIVGVLPSAKPVVYCPCSSGTAVHAARACARTDLISTRNGARARVGSADTVSLPPLDPRVTTGHHTVLRYESQYTMSVRSSQ